MKRNKLNSLHVRVQNPFWLKVSLINIHCDTFKLTFHTCTCTYLSQVLLSSAQTFK